MTALTEPLTETLARQLHEAIQTRRPIAQLTKSHADLTAENAYEIQRALCRFQTGVGDRVTGKKTGLTSKAKQVEMGVEEPIAGYLLGSTILGEDEGVPAGELIHPKAEPEIAFLLGERLQGPGVTAAHVIAATRFVIPALEILDSRFEGFKFALADVIADNCSAGRVVLGSRLVSPAEMDLRLVGMVLEKNGELVSTGAGAAVLGNPANAVAWLANKIAVWGDTLEAGELVMPGSPVASIDFRPGDVVRATFDRIGSVAARCR